METKLKDVRYSWKSQRVFLSLSLFYVPFIDEKKSGIELVAKKGFVLFAVLFWLNLECHRVHSKPIKANPRIRTN